MVVPNMSIKGMITAVPFGRLLWSACVILLAGNIVFYSFFLKGWAGKVSELQAVYAQKRELTTTGGDDAEDGYLKARKDVRTFVDRLPEKATFTDRVRELHDILDRNGLSVEKMTFKPSSVDVLSLSKYTTEFKVAATYPRLKRLLADIQEAPGLFCIEGLSIENQSKDQENVVLSLVISMYFK
jgi:Tfp pilus assembly protein PilO